MTQNTNPSKKWLSYDNQKVLREKCKEVDVNHLTSEDLELMDKMVRYIDASYNDEADKLNIVPGIAIAANQLGQAKQIVYIHFNEGKKEHKYMLLNPHIVSSSMTRTYLPSGEGCLSVKKDHQGLSIRFQKVKVKAYDYLNKKEITIDAKGLLAICLQHEIDHLNGLLYYDRITGDTDNAVPFQLDVE